MDVRSILGRLLSSSTFCLRVRYFYRWVIHTILTSILLPLADASRHGKIIDSCVESQAPSQAQAQAESHTNSLPSPNRVSSASLYSRHDYHEHILTDRPWFRAYSLLTLSYFLSLGVYASWLQDVLDSISTFPSFQLPYLVLVTEVYMAVFCLVEKYRGKPAPKSLTWLCALVLSGVYALSFYFSMAPPF